jgi:PKHD-type hydroxylase
MLLLIPGVGPTSSRWRAAGWSVAVTWVQSLVRDAARRELLYGLNLAREKLLLKAPEAEETAQVNAAYLNLIRMWSDI